VNSIERRLLVVSHPAVVSVNQEVYRELRRRGWDVQIVAPSRWRHSYSQAPVTPQALEGLEGSLLPVPVAFPGRPQRHVYLTRCRLLCARVRPDVAFVEAEPYALAATQWGRACRRMGVPFGVQCYENIDRSLPAPVRVLRSLVLRDAAFVAARSQTAARLAKAWGARGEVGLAPPAVPSWDSTSASHGPALLEPLPAHSPQPSESTEPRPSPTAEPSPAEVRSDRESRGRPFAVGYAGRLIESKGLLDLLEAVRRLQAPVQMLLAGNGELRERLEGQPIPGSHVRVLDGLTHGQMPSAYAQFDVLVLPSHTTATWKEQFGRVIVEALWCGVPVLGSDSGEIPWLIELTGGGLVFPEGDVEALTARLNDLRDSPELRRELATRGRAAVQRLFSVPAATDQLERLLSLDPPHKWGRSVR
jgi:glycosyltransferase involved in cell wall biosynthesis